MTTPHHSEPAREAVAEDAQSLIGELLGSPGFPRTTGVVALRKRAADMIATLLPYRDELLKVAADLGEPDDPFAAWEAVSRLSASPAPAASGGLEAVREALLLVRPVIAGLIEAEYNIETWGLKGRLAKINSALDEPRICDVCGGDCSAANPPPSYCPERDAALAAPAATGGEAVAAEREACRQIANEMPYTPVSDGKSHSMGGSDAAYYMAAKIAKAIEARATTHPAPSETGVKAWQDVRDERRRQVEAEGWTPEHDDAHDKREMACAAACYALTWTLSPTDSKYVPHKFWPWSLDWWKPSAPRRNLVKAGALILAEIERLDRAALEVRSDG